jgi:DNA replication protein DnaC
MTEFEQSISRLTAAFDRSKTESKAFLGTLPASAPCQHHPHIARQRDDAKSWSEGRAVFLPCVVCRAAGQRQQDTERLTRMGVPLNLCGATFENWTADGEQAEANLASVREFASARRGFLVMLGDLGTGKTHLAVAVLRTFKSGWLVKQSELLRCLRDTYRDRAAVDPVDKAQSAGLLVLDEMGLSAGGRDELPLLHDVLDYRHGNQKPTILTGNVTLDGVRLAIGDRMADRLRESNFAVLNFGGASNRREARSKYFWQE